MGCLFFPYPLNALVLGPSIISRSSHLLTQRVLIFKPGNNLTPPPPDPRGFLLHLSELKKLFCKRRLSTQRILESSTKKSFVLYQCIRVHWPWHSACIKRRLVIWKLVIVKVYSHFAQVRSNRKRTVTAENDGNVAEPSSGQGRQCFHESSVKHSPEATQPLWHQEAFLLPLLTMALGHSLWTALLQNHPSRHIYPPGDS